MTAFLTFCMHDPVAGASLGVIIGCLLLLPIYWLLGRLADRE